MLPSYRSNELFITSYRQKIREYSLPPPLQLCPSSPLTQVFIPKPLIKNAFCLFAFAIVVGIFFTVVVVAVVPPLNPALHTKPPYLQRTLFSLKKIVLNYIFRWKNAFSDLMLVSLNVFVVLILFSHRILVSYKTTTREPLFELWYGGQCLVVPKSSVFQGDN